MALINLDDDDDSVCAQTESDDEQRYASIEDEGYRPREQNYTVLTENDIRQRQNDDISHVSSVLSISTSEATTLLCHYGWKISKLHDDWFADEETVRAKVGLGFGRTSGYGSSSPPSLCQICFEDYPPSEILTTSVCAHPYCLTCWRSYVMIAIDDSGSGCLLLKCPDPKCHAAVGLGLIKKLELGGKYESKYEDFLVRSYVEGKRETIQWCPAPGCENAVEFVLGSGDVYDVICSCTNAFCWNCGEEAHRPVDCRTVAEWIRKNSSESENTNWILAYSKPCPKCKRPIEKNNGCNHMTCMPPCGHHFCWLCLEDLRKHHYSCNRYENAGKDKWKNEDERRRELAKQSLERYTHYYERWASNHKSRLKAIEDLNKMKANDLKMLSDKVKQPEVQLGFIMGAWQQIIECRRVLKWTYAYGFYLPEKEHAKRQLFEYSQGEAETNLERLHQCVERELTEKFIQADEDSPEEADFNEFRCKLTGLTKVTCSYFEKLVSALENGLSEVHSQADKKPKAKKRKAAVTVSSGSSSSTSMVPAEVAMTIRPAGVVDLNVGSWNCDRCTYLNPDSARSCQMCFDLL